MSWCISVAGFGEGGLERAVLSSGGFVADSDRHVFGKSVSAWRIWSNLS
jgi:hypothetical protein